MLGRLKVRKQQWRYTLTLDTNHWRRDLQEKHAASSRGGKYAAILLRDGLHQGIRSTVHESHMFIS